MKKILILSLALVILISCKPGPLPAQFIPDDMGIMVEKFNSSDTDKNRYNRDNQIYTVGRRFVFEYFCQDSSGTKYHMTRGAKRADHAYDWYFEPIEKRHPNSVGKVTMSVRNGLTPFLETIPDYNQTVIQYDYDTNNDTFWTNEVTGAIENQENIWLHPPRSEFFQILELNPFPYIKKPYQVGTTWTWKLAFGSMWSDKRWLVWEGTRENIITYTITEKTTMKTKLGNLECLVISATAKSDIGNTSLRSYFNSTYGFVKLDYTNINGSKTVLELVSVE